MAKSKLEKLQEEYKDVKEGYELEPDAEAKAALKEEVDRLEKEIAAEELKQAAGDAGSGASPSPGADEGSGGGEGEDGKKKKSRGRPKSKHTKPAKVKKEKKPKPAKEKPAKKVKKKRAYTIAGKDIDEISCEEFRSLYLKRLEESRKSHKKHKTQSVVTKLAAGLSSVATSAIKSVSKSDIKDNPAAAAKAFKKVGEIIDHAFAQIKAALKPVLESKDMKISAEAKKDLDSLDDLAKKLTEKYKD